MFNILDGRKHFYQWDLDRKLIVVDKSIEEVHFSNHREGEALICKTYRHGDVLLVDVPNILLQDNWRIVAYAYDENYTKHQEEFEVIKRSKPADYVYTETEIKNYDDLVERIEQIEENGISDEAVEGAVEKYLEENGFTVDLTGYATEEYVQEQISHIDIPDTNGLASESYVDENLAMAVSYLEGELNDRYRKHEIDEMFNNIDIPEGTGAEEVYVGNEAPTDENIKIWIDTDADSPVATKEYVAQKIQEAQIGGAEIDLSDYYTKDEADEKFFTKEEFNVFYEELETALEEDIYTKEEVDAKIQEIELTPGAPGKDGKDGVDGKDGKDGEDYVLTEADKQEIAGMVEVSGEDVDLSNYYTKEETTAAINEALNAIGIAEEVSF